MAQREPTKAEIAKFHSAVKALNELGKAGFHLYLANNTMNLMVGPSHDENGHPQHDNVREWGQIAGAGGGDW